MQKYLIKGDHPILKRIDWIAVGLDDMNKKIHELIAAGYEVKIELIPDDDGIPF